MANREYTDGVVIELHDEAHYNAEGGATWDWETVNGFQVLTVWDEDGEIAFQFPAHQVRMVCNTPYTNEASCDV